jgi:YbbR domain-containing protein
MTRLLGAIVYNWPLKIMAIALATLLYAALVLAQNQQTRQVSVQIEPSNQPPSTIVVGDLGQVTEVRYFVADQENVTISSANFTARVDLSQIRPGTQAQSVKVIVDSADPRIQVMSATPEFVSVKLEDIRTKEVPVNVVVGTIPAGLDVRPPTQSIRTATVRGAESDIARVTAVRATVPIDNSALGIDRDFPLTPVDQLLEPVRGVDVDPTSVRVTMLVFHDVQTASVRIVPNIPGNPAPGFEVAGVTLSSEIVSLEGDAADLATVANIQTEPVSIEGRTQDLDATVGFVVPQGVSVVNPVTVKVHVVIRAVTGSRTFNAGIEVIGNRADRAYDLSIPAALLVVGGSPVDLDRLNGATIHLNADVTGLDVGVHQVKLTIPLQAGLTVVAITPEFVTVTVSPIAGSSAGPSAGPGG